MSTKKLPKEASVVVIGAGLSGLVAARELVKSGHDVVVVEAQDEVGGRLKSITRDNGMILQRGGELTGAIQSEFQALAAEFGVESEPVPFGVNMENGGQMVSVIDGERIVEPYPMSDDPDSAAAYGAAVELLDALAAEIPEREPWNAPRARELDQHSLGTWLDANIEHPAARAGLEGALSVFGDPYEVSMLYIASFMSAWGGLEVHETALMERFIGGTAQFPTKLAEELGDRVQLSAPVRKVTHDENGVIVDTDRGSIKSGAVIFAIAPGQCSMVEFDPPLSPQRDRLQTRTLGNHGAKFYVIYDKPFWRDEGLAGVAGGLPFAEVYFDASPTDASEGVLIGFQFAAGPSIVDRAEALRDPESVRAAVLDDLTACFGEQAKTPTEFHYFPWHGSRWSDGCAIQFPPGVLSTVGHTLREPVGRIFWGGAESEPIDYMEGAVRAGKRTAAEASAVLA